MRTWLKRWFGIHLHRWIYYTHVSQWRVRRRRRCTCGVEQEYIFVPSAPMAWDGWVNVDEL